MRNLIILHFALSIASVFIVFLMFDLLTAASFFFGALVMGGNLFVLGKIWASILNKKPVATWVSASIIKYTVLFSLVYAVAKTDKLALSWFAYGTLTFIATTVLAIPLREKILGADKIDAL
jgi:hypothetical protein